jgi:hypothetical protein
MGGLWRNGRKRWYEEIKSNARRCVKVLKLGVFSSFKKILSFALLSL